MFFVLVFISVQFAILPPPRRFCGGVQSLDSMLIFMAVLNLQLEPMGHNVGGDLTFLFMGLET